MKFLHPVKCFFVLTSKNKGRKKNVSVSRAWNQCSILTVILAHSQPLCGSWNMLLLLAVFITAQRQPPYVWSPLFPLASCTMVLMGPKAVPINKTLLLLFSQDDNSFQIANESTILACKYAQTQLSLNNRDLSRTSNPII